jgi:hypothetical protein
MLFKEVLNRAGQMAILNRARISRATILDKGGDADLCGEDLCGEDLRQGGASG